MLTAMNELTPLLLEQIAEAKTNKERMDCLVNAYMPFIKRCISSVFFKKEQQEEYVTEAMLGFLQSVQTFSNESGAFIPYAQTVIRNRLLNVAAKESRIKKWHIPLFSKKTPSNNEDTGNYLPVEIEAAQRNYELTVERENLRCEIAEINTEFAGWDFNVIDLSKHRPKQNRSRLTCQIIASAALAHPDLITEMKVSRKLPIKKLTVLTGYSEKIFEKYRRYIVALILIMSGDYPYIRSFIPSMKDFSKQEGIL
jgi:RNA polymerase sigma factor